MIVYFRDEKVILAGFTPNNGFLGVIVEKLREVLFMMFLVAPPQSLSILFGHAYLIRRMDSL